MVIAVKTWIISLKKDKRTNNDIQNTTDKTKRLSNMIPTKTGANPGAPEGFSVNRGEPRCSGRVFSTHLTHLYYICLAIQSLNIAPLYKHLSNFQDL